MAKCSGKLSANFHTRGIEFQSAKLGSEKSNQMIEMIRDEIFAGKQSTGTDGTQSEHKRNICAAQVQVKHELKRELKRRTGRTEVGAQTIKPAIAAWL